MAVILNHLLTGSLAPLGPRAVPSGIDKQPVTGPRRLTRTGIVGDAQGDPRHHGGPDKAVHHYPFQHYAAWIADLGPLPRLGQAGGFGENLSIAGLDEMTVAVGDVFRLGTALIEVSQGRQPCWKLNIRFGIADMARRVQQTGRTGWYYRVLEEGEIAAGDALTLVERRAADWPLARLWRILYVDVLNRDELRAMAAQPRLPEGWRNYAEKRLAAGQVEDWRSRLDGDRAG